jgi:hypothetical protein
MMSGFFNDVLNDKITIQKTTGQVFDNIRAHIDGNKVLIADIQLPLEEGDKIYRKLRNGLIETFVVVDRGFVDDPYGGLSHYDAKIKRESNMDKDEYHSVVLNLNDNSRVNINSTDNSQNTINSSDVFENIRQELQAIKDEKVRAQAIKTLDELKAEQNKPTFAGVYMKFMGIIADHITLAIPLIQALTKMLP